jgi:hypothetical protein
MDVDDLRWNNYFSEAENRNHFILSTHENHFRKIQGRRISPKGLPVRPTTDMSKEALFNVINNHFSFEENTRLILRNRKYQL